MEMKHVADKSSDASVGFMSIGICLWFVMLLFPEYTGFIVFSID